VARVTRDQVDVIAQRAALGWSAKEIAAAVGVTVNQARYQLRKLSLSNRAQAPAVALDGRMGRGDHPGRSRVAAGIVADEEAC